MISTDPKNLTFVLAAEHYCELIEQVHNYSFQDFVRECLGRLSVLYGAALHLPTVSINDGAKKLSGERVSHEEWKQIYEKISEKLNGYDCYQDFFDPFNHAEAGCYSSIADDLADVYRDLKAGLVRFQQGIEAEALEALWECRFSFYSHWGSHAVGALRACHLVFVDQCDWRI